MNFRQLKDTLINGTIPCDLNIDGISLRSSESAVPLLWESAEEGYSASVSIKGLTLTLFCREYEARGFELCLTLKNTSDKPSPKISGIRTLIIRVPDSEKKDDNGYHHKRVLYAQGSHAIAEDFMPREYPVSSVYLPGLKLNMSETRSSSGIMPYFNYMQDEENGLFAAVGWSGHWCAEFGSDNTITFSYPGADFSLDPGEAVDLPSALLVPWHAPSADDHNPESFNIFRRFMKEFIAPRIKGKTYEGSVCLRAWGRADEAGHNIRWDNMKKYCLPSDAYGVDAGWYDDDGFDNKDWFSTAGDWEPDPKVFPKATASSRGGLAWLADGGRAAGSAGFWLWFEFERAVKQSKSFREHPEYYYISPYGMTDNQIRMDNTEARHAILNKLVRIFKETGMSIFRIDYNIDPGSLFAYYDSKTGDAGRTELRYYNGLYRFFEELKAELPDLIIDNCASGGRRLDYRMYRYAVPIMCRSDFFTIPDQFDPIGAQAHTMALARFLPVQSDSCGSCLGTTPILFDTYRVRSSMSCGIGIAAPSWPLTEEEGAWYRDILTEAMMVKPYMSMNFYPLTGYSLSRLDWVAWQTVSDDGLKAMVMAFRRDQSMTDNMTFALHGLIPETVYEITDSKGNIIKRATGASLAEGYNVFLPDKRSSAIHFFKPVQTTED